MWCTGWTAHLVEPSATTQPTKPTPLVKRTFTLYIRCDSARKFRSLYRKFAATVFAYRGCTVPSFLPNYSFYFISICRPPSNSVVDNDILLTFLPEFCFGKHVTLVEDFNLPSVRWNKDLICRGLSPTELPFYTCVHFLRQTQWVHECIYYSSGNTRMLDLILASEEDRVIDVQISPPFPNCELSLFTCRHILQHPPLIDDFPLLGLWTKGNCNLINKHLLETDWNHEFCHLNVCNLYNSFLETVYFLVVESVAYPGFFSERANTYKISSKYLAPEVQKQCRSVSATLEKNTSHKPQL